MSTCNVKISTSFEKSVETTRRSKMASRKVLAIVLVTVGSFVVLEATRTCRPELPIKPVPALGILGSGGFEVCLFDATGNYLTDGIAGAGNTIWTIQAALYAGNCYCNQDCRPSQIACEDALDLGIGNVTNGIAKFVYNGIAYQFYCFCPEYIDADEACDTPLDPEQCNPA